MPDLSTVTRHVVSQIMAAKIEHWPFPHVEVSELVPDAYYTELQKNLPPHSSFRPVGGDESNYVFVPLDGTVTEPAGTTEFWRDFDGVVNRAIMLAALEKFRTVADRYVRHMRWRGIVRPFFTTAKMAQEPQTSVQIFRRRYSYAAEPHYHSIQEFVSGLYYLATDRDHGDLGTQLYEIVEPFHATFEELAVYTRVERLHVRLVKTAKYLPNHALLYLNTPWAIHGNGKFDHNYERRFCLLKLSAAKSQMMGDKPGWLNRIYPNANRFAAQSP